ncbi:hypothetical protein PV325_012326 [Microctonus aethiopoides]|nr:hypothetical protein PV325_012326 [Microctonus aethiopoides]
MSSCELNDIFLGEVAAIQNYGAFVKIPGCKQQGLIHQSQVSGSRIDDVAEVLQRGERVWCKIISVSDDGKIGLSMKVVNQGNGTDLDPNGVEMHREEQKRKTFGTSQKKIIELQAVLNTTCTKCGTNGHLAKDCFATPDGKKYELLPEIEDDSMAQPPSLSESQLKLDKEEKKSESKKLKKRKKSKKSKHKSESTSDNSSNEDERKKKKKKKKHSKETKRKKRKHSECSSEESSDSVVREKHSKKCKHSKSKHSD